MIEVVVESAVELVVRTVRPDLDEAAISKFAHRASKVITAATDPDRLYAELAVLLSDLQDGKTPGVLA